jgi:hypothetical protein
MLSGNEESKEKGIKGNHLNLNSNLNSNEEESKMKNKKKLSDGSIIKTLNENGSEIPLFEISVDSMLL